MPRPMRGNLRTNCNSILKGHTRPWNLSHCEIEGCCNFIVSLSDAPRFICRSHTDGAGKRLPECRGLKRISQRTKKPKQNRSSYQIYLKSIYGHSDYRRKAERGNGH